MVMEKGAVLVHGALASDLASRIWPLKRRFIPGTLVAGQWQEDKTSRRGKQIKLKQKRTLEKKNG